MTCDRGSNTPRRVMMETRLTSTPGELRVETAVFRATASGGPSAPTSSEGDTIDPYPFSANDVLMIFLKTSDPFGEGCP